MKLLMHGIPAVVFLFVLTNFAHMHSMTFCSGDSGGGGGDKFLSSGDGPMPHGGDKGGGATVLSSGNGGAMELSSGALLIGIVSIRIVAPLVLFVVVPHLYLQSSTCIA